MRGCFNDRRRHRFVSPLRFSSRIKLLRLSAPECVARWLLHEHERIQLIGNRVPWPATIRVRSREDAGRSARNVHHAGHHGWSTGRNLSARGSRRCESAAARCSGDIHSMARSRLVSHLSFPCRLRDAGEFDFHALLECSGGRVHATVCHSRDRVFRSQERRRVWMRLLID